MPDRKAVQKEYDKLFKVKPNKWDNPDRSSIFQIQRKLSTLDAGMV